MIMRLPAQLLRREPDSHKGNYGYLLALGGSLGLTGAICLCARAALRAGAGVVKAGVPKSLNPVFEAKLTEEMTLPLSDINGHLKVKAFSEIRKDLKKTDVIALGPGIGVHSETKKLIFKILKGTDKPLVIDADAINLLAGNLRILKQRKNPNLILTPHLGEFSRLIKKEIGQIKSSRKELAKEFALRYNLTLVLKGNKTVVANGKEIFENDTGNPGMATAGSGDVLCGIIAALVARGLDTYLAAKLGVYLHGLSGDFAAKEKTQNCIIASDLIEYLPQAFKKLFETE